MLREKRHALILDQLKQDQIITIQDLSENLHVSYMTVWRDLEALEQLGQVQRIRGGAILPSDEKSDSRCTTLPGYLGANFDINQGHKSCIGRYVAQELVENGDFVTIEAGSTASRIAPFLTQSNLTVLTNGLLTSMFLFPMIRQVNVLCCGGVLIETGAFIGPQAEDFFTQFRVKKAFFGAQGFSLEDGFTDPTPLYMRLKDVMRQHTEKVIMMLDSSKLGVRSLVPVMKLEDIDILVTDEDAPSNLIEMIRDRGLDVRIAPARI